LDVAQARTQIDDHWNASDHVDDCEKYHGHGGYLFEIEFHVGLFFEGAKVLRE
jgi:hypothetical protein